MSKVLFGILDAKKQVDVPLGITSHVRVIFETYPLDQPIYFSLYMEKAHLDEVAQSQPIQDKPKPSTTIPSQPQVDSEPSASSSQNSEVTKKKRKKKEPLVIVFENINDETIGENTESTLASLVPRKKKQKSKTGSQYAPSQKDADIIIWENLILEVFSQQSVSIEKSILPNAPCTESIPLQGNSF